MYIVADIRPQFENVASSRSVIHCIHQIWLHLTTTFPDPWKILFVDRDLAVMKRSSTRQVTGSNCKTKCKVASTSMGKVCCAWRELYWKTVKWIWPQSFASMFFSLLIDQPSYMTWCGDNVVLCMWYAGSWHRLGWGRAPTCESRSTKTDCGRLHCKLRSYDSVIKWWHIKHMFSSMLFMLNEFVKWS